MATEPPVIDLSNFVERKDEITAQLMEAATTIGFFYVKGHGIPQHLVDAAFQSAADFFAKPQEYKDTLPKVDWAGVKVLGYEINPTTDGTIHESWMSQYECHDDMKKSWPDVPNYKENALDFMEAMQPVAKRILSCFATALGYPANFFDEIIRVDTPENHTFLQYHKYPSVEGINYKPGTNRLTAHTDESLITLLWPSPGSVGLELASGKSGTEIEGQDKKGYYKVDTWMECPQKEGCITINLGDPLQMWSDGILKSNYHRVRLPREGESEKERFSMGYFVWPLLSTPIQGQKGTYAPTTMGEWMKTKGKNYAQSFAMDADTYEAQQEFAFGFVEGKGAEVKAAA